MDGHSPIIALRLVIALRLRNFEEELAVAII
jgi:hypothetical protein